MTQILFSIECSRLFFFPQCSVMEANELVSGSYAWKSILCGRDVIQRGSCWRVGDRRSINIWQHHWLLIKHPTKIASPMVETMDEATVDCLIMLRRYAG